jgi:uncharacterized protein (TIGR03067 family)
MRWLMCAFVTVGLALTADAVPGDATKKDLDAMQGVWQVVSLEIDGKALPEDQFKAFKLTIKGDKGSHPGDDGKTEEATLKLDASKKPKTIDIMPLTGSDKGKTIRGIYSLEGDTLKVCANHNGDARPTEFKGGKDIVLFTMKREKAK